MKTLKITLLMLAVVVLTVSVVKTENVDKQEDVTTYKKETSTYDLLAHTKKKRGVKEQA